MTSALVMNVLDALGEPSAFWLASILLVYGQAAIWHSFTTQTRLQEGMVFGIRARPEFLHSTQGGAIARTFHVRVWTWATILVIACIAAISTSRLSDIQMSYLLLGTLIASLVGSLLLFSIAHRAVRLAAPLIEEPSERAASLWVAEDEANAWLSLVDWLATLLPLVIPAATALLLAIHGYHHSQRGDFESAFLRIALAVFLGTYPAATQFALRYGARSADWASDPLGSRKRRTFLGLTQSSIFTLIVLHLCALSLVDGVFPSMQAYFRFSELTDFAVAAFVLTMLFWLRRNRAHGSGDPMSDQCWKWGWFYYNPSDPALVVPQRSGFGFSFNYGRQVVCVVGSLIFAAVILGLILA
jgi:uncharacterized membrane protein